MEHPRAIQCNVLDNPLHNEQLEVVKMLRDRTNDDIYSINTVIDEDRNLGFVNFGEIESSHGEAMNFADRYCVVPVNRRFGTVVTSSAGYPLDQTYYQAVKGMVTPFGHCRTWRNACVGRGMCRRSWLATRFGNLNGRCCSRDPSDSSNTYSPNNWQTLMSGRPRCS